MGRLTALRGHEKIRFPVGALQKQTSDGRTFGIATVAEKVAARSIASSGLYRVPCGVRKMKETVDAPGTNSRRSLGVHFDRITQLTQAADQ